MKKLQVFDYIMLAVIVVIIAVGALVVSGKNTKLSKSPVEETKDIQFQVMFKGVSLTDTELPIVKGEKSFITIRNVPYSELEITDVRYAPKKYILPIPNPQAPFALIDDPTQPLQYDIIVTLKDSAKITNDGAVVGGNKIKSGMPIVLEGFNYRFGGTVSNIIVPGKTQLGKGEPLPQGKSVQPGYIDPQPQQGQVQGQAQSSDSRASINEAKQEVKPNAKK